MAKKISAKNILLSTFTTIGFFLMVGLVIVFLSYFSQKIPDVIKPQANPIYPDKVLTPGEVFTNATKDEVCTPGYTTQVRNVSVKTKKLIYQEYGVSYPQPRGDYEVDHFIPLELGGSNDMKNLFLEPAEPRPGFHEKDIVENYLHAQVCSGTMELKEAQESIREDWYKVYQSIPNPDKYNFSGD